MNEKSRKKYINIKISSKQDIRLKKHAKIYLEKIKIQRYKNICNEKHISE